MDHNLSYRGPILVIQKPKINLSNKATISMKDTSPISPFSLPKINPKIWTVYGFKIGQPMVVPENGP